MDSLTTISTLTTFQEDQESVARQFNDYSPEEIGRALDTFYVPASYRQSGGGGGGGGSLGTIIELAVKFLPLIMSTFSGAGGSGSSSASSSSPALAASPSTNSVDRIETIDIKVSPISYASI